MRALPFILVREIYALLGVFIKNPDFKNNTTAKAIMSVVPEILCTVILLFVGIHARNICKHRNMTGAKYGGYGNVNGIDMTGGETHDHLRASNGNEASRCLA